MKFSNAGLVSGAVLLAIAANAQTQTAQPSGKPLGVFAVNEIFGVTHPTQVIDFESGPVDPANSYMMGPDGAEVPFQRLANGNIAVQTDLPANARRTWTLFGGRHPNQFPGTVKMTATPGWYEVTNGITGVRVARPERDTRLAPIQGVQLQNGVWTATGPNYVLEPKDSSPAATLPPLPALKAAAKILEQGPLNITIELTYSYNRAPLQYGGKLLIPGGPGFYKSTISLKAGSPSIMIEDDSDMDLRYDLNVYKGVEPDQARYRGHTASALDFGRDGHGLLYATTGKKMDAIREISYERPIYSSYTTSHNRSYDLLSRLALWNPWAQNTGWYWMIYNQKAAPGAAVAGIFSGRVSRLLGVNNSGPGLSFLPADASGNKAAEIEMQINRLAPDRSLYKEVRMSWGIFTGTKEKDVTDPYQVQTIGRESNLNGGFNLNKVRRYQTSYDDPSGGYQPLYMSRTALLSLINRVRTDVNYSNYLSSAEPTCRILLDLWRDNTGKKVGDTIDKIGRLARSHLQTLVSGDGIHDFNNSYWMGGLQMDRAAVMTNVILAGEPVAERDRATLKAASVLFASILWDNDFVPMFDGAGVNMGTANMPVQQAGYRNLYALMLANHPMMKETAKTVAAEVTTTLSTEINEYGAQRGSPHYASASMEPVLDTVLQMKRSGIADLFRTETRVGRFGDFYMNLLTPQEPRFGGLRKLISVGDGATESSPLFGELATGLAGVDPALSARLMGAWQASGKMQSGFHGTTILKIDDTLPAKQPTLGSVTFPGWYSVMRSGFGTTDETALWFINGSFLSDHRHFDDGSLVMYALGAPLSMDWGSMYSPHTSSAYLHSVVLPEAEIGNPWDGDSPALEQGQGGPAPWTGAKQDAFETFEYSTHSLARFQRNNMTWNRSVLSIHPDQSRPIVVISDTFSGPAAGVSKVSTLNLMAQDVVHVPGGGSMFPPQRIWESSGTRKELPSATPPAALPPGVNAFQFTGQWGVNWNLYTVSAQPQQFLIGNWAHDWLPSEEQSEFQRANSRAFKERQYIFRVKGSGAFQTVIVPYRAGAKAPEMTRSDAGLTFQSGAGEQLTITGDRFYAYKSATRTILGSFTAAAASAYGIATTGGPVEITIVGDQAYITLSGEKGRRAIRLPGSWISPGAGSAATAADGTIAIDYEGGNPKLVRLGRQR